MKSLKLLINNIEKEYNILYSFKSDKTNKNYLICTDNTYTNDELNVYSFIYYPNDSNKGIEVVKLKSDLEEINNFINLVGFDYE